MTPHSSPVLTMLERQSQSSRDDVAKVEETLRSRLLMAIKASRGAIDRDRVAAAQRRTRSADRVTTAADALLRGAASHLAATRQLRDGVASEPVAVRAPEITTWSAPDSVRPLPQPPHQQLHQHVLECDEAASRCMVDAAERQWRAYVADSMKGEAQETQQPQPRGSTLLGRSGRRVGHQIGAVTSGQTTTSVTDGICGSGVNAEDEWTRALRAHGVESDAPSSGLAPASEVTTDEDVARLRSSGLASDAGAERYDDQDPTMAQERLVLKEAEFRSEIEHAAGQWRRAVHDMAAGAWITQAALRNARRAAEAQRYQAIHRQLASLEAVEQHHRDQLEDIERRTRQHNERRFAVVENCNSSDNSFVGSGDGGDQASHIARGREQHRPNASSRPVEMGAVGVATSDASCQISIVHREVQIRAQISFAEEQWREKVQRQRLLLTVQSYRATGEEDGSSSSSSPHRCRADLPPSSSAIATVARPQRSRITFSPHAAAATCAPPVPRKRLAAVPTAVTRAKGIIASTPPTPSISRSKRVFSKSL